jgi:hypothetical protein
MEAPGSSERLVNTYQTTLTGGRGDFNLMFNLLLFCLFVFILFLLFRLLSNVLETLSPGVKRPGNEADHTPPSSAEVKNGGIVPPFPIPLQGVAFN